MSSEPHFPLPNLAAAPHRLLFFVGAFNVLAMMAWWTLWLAAQRGWLLALPQPAIPAGWAHALLMPLQVLAPFMFGFLLTVFPRWMNQPALSHWHYLPVGLGIFGGQVLMLVGLWGHPLLVHLGTIFSLAGWIASMIFLGGLIWRDGGRCLHALSAFAALTMGLAAWLLFAGWLHAQGKPLLMFAAIKIAVFGFALPVYLTVCHRMLPFFASVAIKDYQPWRPPSLLLIWWLLAFAHLLLELMHGYAWLWLADLPLALLTAFTLWRWWPRAPMPGLLRVLLLGFAWLPLSFALFAAQSLVFLIGDQFILGRAPVHALTIGFFGSLLVAMVTRVTQGHSGRPLQMNASAWFAFGLIQIVALVRILAELAQDGLRWQVIAGALWLLAFLPWAIRSMAIYLAPRVDGQAG